MNISQDLIKFQPANSQQSARSIDNLQSVCLSHMASNGIPCDGPLNTQGTIRRFSIGSRKNKNGWYIAWEGISSKGNYYIICIYGSWKTGEKFEYRSWSECSILDEEERIELQRHLNERREAGEKAIKIEQSEVAKECQSIWEAAANVHPSERHLEYLQKKGVKNYGLRFGNNEKGYPSLIIPLKNALSEIRSLQYISVGQDGTVYKTFHSGGEKKGNYFVIGSIANGEPFYVCEGYATGASAHEAIENPVVVTFDCNNLSPVIENLRRAHSESSIIILADDDKETQSIKEVNPGKNAAEKAAKQYGCDFIVPVFPNNLRLADGKLPSDFNDLHIEVSLDEVKKQLTTKISLTWKEPNPIQDTQVPVSAFDFENLFPKELSDFVRDESERMVCPPDFVAAALLVSLGSIIGARCAIRPKSKDDWIIVPNLWGGCVGVPTTKKSPAIAAAMKPLNQLATKARKQHQQAANQFEANKIVFVAKKEAIEAKLKLAAKSSKNQEIDQSARELQALQADAPTPPLEHRYKTNDTTIEKLGVMLSQNPQGLLVLRDEIVGLVASWDKAGHEGDRAFFLESWNGTNDFNTDRIGRGDIYIENLCTSLFGGIQPDKLTGYLEQAANALGNDGMLQRFQILVYPDPIQWQWRDRCPDLVVREQIYAIFEALADFDPVAWGASPQDNYCKFPYFHFDDEAQEIFINWSAHLNTKTLQSEDNPLISQHLAKYENLFPALALIFHLVECVRLGNTPFVQRAAATRAASWCDYLETHARRCYGLLADDGLRAAQALASKLSKSKMKDDFTAHEVRRNQWRYLTTHTAVQAALDWLEDEGWLKSYEVGGRGPGSGRPTRRYRINPRIKKSEGFQDDEAEA